MIFFLKSLELNIINNQQKKCTIKDIPAKEFIEAFAKYLKKGNKIKMPEVCRTFQSRCSLSSYLLTFVPLFFLFDSNLKLLIITVGNLL